MAAAAAWTGSRRLLKRLRDLMAAESSAQARLDRVVRLIAADMVAEVCSAYILRAGEVLELFATEGLRPEAVHNTRLHVGEGLVGDIALHARPLALADAWAHPKFAYRPETGEEIYRSLMGVPIMRSGRVTGVLVVQNRTQRGYTEEEVETLETVAMVLAELVASGELVDPDEAHDAESALAPRRLEGVKLHDGVAVGQAVLHQPRIVIRQMVAEDPKAEHQRLERAVLAMQSALDRMLASEELGAGEHRDVLETYRMFAEDRGWLGRIRETIQGGLTAEAAVQKVQNDMRARMRDILDPYLRDRLQDLEDLSARLLRQLMGPVAAASRGPLPDDLILVARTMGPAELLDYDRKRLRGLVLEDASLTSHVAIVARALDIPVVARVANAFDRIETGDPLVVDGDHGQVLVRPTEDVLASVRAAMEVRAAATARYAALADRPVVSRDGIAVTLLLNCGLSIDVAQLDATRAAGIGLFRTEIAFMVRQSYPDIAAQAEIYRSVLDRAGDRPVMFRTLDVGGDKRLSYLPPAREENPAMGWRAIRIGLDRPALLRQQLRAMILAADGRPLSIMFPMIADVGEIRAARAILAMELAAAVRRPEPLQVGIMVEVPALMWQLADLLPAVDFLSVGSNDLVQFLYAADRGNPLMAERYDPLSAPVLRCLAQLAAAADAAGKPITVCGEMAGRPLEALALLGIGYRRLSMAGTAVGPVREAIRAADVSLIRRLLERLLGRPEPRIRTTLKAFARDHGLEA